MKSPGESLPSVVDRRRTCCVHLRSAFPSISVFASTSRPAWLICLPEFISISELQLFTSHLRRHSGSSPRPLSAALNLSSLSTFHFLPAFFSTSSFPLLTFFSFASPVATQPKEPRQLTPSHVSDSFPPLACFVAAGYLRASGPAAFRPRCRAPSGKATTHSRLSTRHALSSSLHSSSQLLAAKLLPIFNSRPISARQSCL